MFSVWEELAAMRRSALQRDVLRGPAGFGLYSVRTRRDAIEWLSDSAVKILAYMPVRDLHPENPALRALGVLLASPEAHRKCLDELDPERRSIVEEAVSREPLPWSSGQLEWQWAQYAGMVREQLRQDPRWGTGIVHPPLSLTMNALKDLESLIAWGIVDHEVRDLRHAAVIWQSDAEGAFAVAAENAIRNGAQNATKRMIDAAWIEVPGDAEGRESWPARLAEAVSARLAARGEQDPKELIFTAVAASADAVHVCWAGDLRLHVLQRGEVVWSTRDHVLANEPPAWVDANFPPGMAELHGNVLTRALGRKVLPYETARFDVKGPFSLLLCSSGMHFSQPGTDYVKPLLSSSWRETKEGFALQIPR